MRVKGHSNLKKSNGAVVSTDMKAYDAAKLRKQEKKRINSIEARMDKIENLLLAVLGKLEEDK